MTRALVAVVILSVTLSAFVFSPPEGDPGTELELGLTQDSGPAHDPTGVTRKMGPLGDPSGGTQDMRPLQAPAGETLNMGPLHDPFG